MTTILFHAGPLSLRGTGVAIYDYACGNERLLGGRSIIAYDADVPHDTGMFDKFSQRFELLPLAAGTDLDQYEASRQADLVYSLGTGVLSQRLPCMVHAVFRTRPSQVRGASFAYVSDWLARFCSNGRLPAVPHMISLPAVDADLRAELGIPAGATVFGGMGGAGSFDLEFARGVVCQVADARPDIWFLFLNITPFAEHPRIRFLPGTGDMQYKTAFINSCDAMLHARKRGETFGLACGEFSVRNKPVITYGCSGERNHLDVLGDRALCYYGPRTLRELLLGFDREVMRTQQWDVYSERFAPERVMQQFDEVLVQPALRNGPGDSLKLTFGLRDRMACVGERAVRRGHRLSRWRDWAS